MPAYRFEGYWKDVGTLDSLWDANMDMLAQGSGLNLLDKDWPIYARAESEPPAYLGETAEVGDDCLIYHGVTLGGTGKDTGKRHPTLGDNVLIGAGAKVLGPVYIGDNVRVGAGSVVLKNLPANATAVGVPAEIVRVGNIKCCPADDLDQQDLPDIVNQRISELEARLSRLEAEKQGEFPPDKKE